MEVFETLDTLNLAAAEYIVAIAKKAIAERGRFSIALSGGETPKSVYSVLAQSPFREQIQWERIFIFFGDERCVPLDDKRNNAYQAKLALLDKIDIPTYNIHRIPVNLPPEQAASIYEKEIKLFFEYKPLQFDFIMLGLGENGHAASLFPETKVIHEQSEGVRAVFVEEERMFRITMTAPLINQAHHILFLVTGENKAIILKKILTDSYQPDKYPAQLIKPLQGDLRWFADRAAASLI